MLLLIFFYFLGDFCLKDIKYAEDCLQRLNGNKFFIKGNHDNHQFVKLCAKYGVYLGEQSKITIHGKDIILNHFAMRVWNRSHHNSWHLYGHSHGGLEGTPWGKSMDVGINVHDYYPLSFDQIKSIMDKRDAKILEDHHR